MSDTIKLELSEHVARMIRDDLRAGRGGTHVLRALEAEITGALVDLAKSFALGIMTAECPRERG